MITVFGGQTSRSIRVVWLMEEMGLDYQISQVNMLDEGDFAALRAVNPAGYIPAIQDGEVTMVESIAIMEYLMAHHGPTPLAPAPRDPAFPAYQQFLHLGEAGLATFANVIIMSRYFAPEAEQNDWSAGQARRWIEARLKLVRRQLERTPYLAGEAFTAADISVTYGLQLAGKHAGVLLGELEEAYLSRTTGREAFKRAMETSHAGVG